MRYIPNYRLNVIAEEDFANTIDAVIEEISAVKQTGNFAAFDNTNIYYEYFLAENSKGSIVIVHGLSEFTCKYYEFIYYALNQGFNVFIYDQRCHGNSGRLTPVRDLLHVDNFSDYVDDLNYFINEVVLKIEDKPLYMLANSMGGAVASLYMAEHKNKIKKAVLLVPMLRPTVNDVPLIIANVSVWLGKVFVGSKKKCFISDEFDPSVPFSNKEGLSRARFEFNMKMRRENENYQSTPMSYGWVNRALNISKKLLGKKVLEQIETPILLLSAKEDKMVENSLQKIFADNCKSCSFEEIEKSTHAILATEKRILTKVLNLTFDFFS